LACGGRLCLFLRRRLARGFRRLVAHRHNAKVHGDRRQLNGLERSQRAPAPWAFGKMSEDFEMGSDTESFPPTKLGAIC
jgi:hypothetical protein